ncbi:hypothetical protein KA047_02910 [Candidatus Saccharibacteria bacterium]|nr:hypothetical protein [Candidatus Saccharibacteria bacterium]
MLVTNLEKLNQIDQEITDLQSNLSSLYQKRSQLFASSTQYKDRYAAAIRKDRAKASVKTPDTETANWYNELASEWHARGIAIPTYKTLQRRIAKAQIAIDDLSAELQVSPDLFTMQLIPPTQSLSQEQLNILRLHQPHVRYSDQNETIIEPTTSKKWRLLVIYDGIDGLDFGSAEEILASQSYIIAGHDARGFGIHEYAVYALRHTTPRDHHSWTWLLNHDVSEPVSVSFISGAYRFAQDDPKGYMQTERFRPCVEVA